MAVWGARPLRGLPSRPLTAAELPLPTRTGPYPCREAVQERVVRRGSQEVRMFLRGATVVILGGSSGIGLATAKAARAEGATLIVTGRSMERLKAAQIELGTDARTVPLDVNDEGGT